jgi:hypothetical protein
MGFVSIQAKTGKKAHNFCFLSREHASFVEREERHHGSANHTSLGDERVGDLAAGR